MGSYWQLSIDGFEVISGKSYLDPQITALFSECDRRRQLQSRDGRRFKSHSYEISVSQMLERLAMAGFSSDLTARVFALGIADRLDDLEEYTKEDDENPYVAERSRERKQLQSMTFKKWVTTVRSILSKKYAPLFEFENDPPRARPSEKFILRSGYGDDLHYGFPWSDPRILIHAFCIAARPSAAVSLDFTDLIGGGYLSTREMHSRKAREGLAQQHLECAPVLILTEGSSDAKCLKLAIQLLFPHMAHLLSFLDFGEGNNPGGVGPLGNLLKAFLASGVQTRIVGLFDNDAAAHATIKKLPKMPMNIAVTTLPSYTLLTRYPTLGPQRRQRMDINGRAASLELFMGKDVLRENGHYIPIQWTGFEKSVKLHQGELLDKDGVKKRFLAKANVALTRGSVPGHDWEGMRLVCRHVIETASLTRFRNLRPDELLADRY